jgi:hypothetical protein
MASEAQIKVQVCYARPDVQAVAAVTLPAGATVEQAIRASGLLQRFTDIDLNRNPVGVFGKAVELGKPLKGGERVEIYRPLTADPKEVRRKLAAEGKTMGKKPVR